MLHHFWSTGGALKVDRLWVEYFLDGETTPSISFQPSQMCGLAAAFLPEFNNKTGHTDLYHAGAMCGRNSAVGGFFNTFPIPFQKSALVTVRSDPQDCATGCCGGGYLNVRGTENLPIVVPGSVRLFFIFLTFSHLSLSLSFLTFLTRLRRAFRSR